MTGTLTQLTTLGLADTAHGAVGAAPWWALLIPLLPIAGVLLCGLMACFDVRSKAPAWATVGCLAAAFGLTLALFTGSDGATTSVTAFDWINLSWDHGGHAVSLVANFGLSIDGLTILWMLFVTGLAAMIALYASEYMSHDVGLGYCRFFAAFNLFVFSMSCLVMGDNLLFMYLGWEGVGLCSYLLIGYFYKKPSAVAAAKKAFIVNRIGDLGLALGIYLTFVHFGTIEYSALFSSEKLLGYVDAAQTGDFSSIPAIAQAIPLLLMIGAFGKSAQLPLYVWLPDAMEGPTPVSALIHAATMVTAGVYLIARMFPVFLISEHALMIVAWVGTLTALLAATIGMAQFDIKRIMAYSTVSQLGYMFAGLGVLTTAGGAFHVFTHAFFKAVLFLSCGAVMHGFAGQLDLRRLSGLWKVPGWGIVSLAMLIGCVNLAGVPGTAGYFSKDMILAEAFVTPGRAAIGWILLLTAGLTAYYTFRVFFRVFMGPVEYHPGEEHDDDDGHGFHPHAPGWAINTVLAVLAVCSILAAGVYFVQKDHHGWVGSMVHDSTAAYHSPYADELHHLGEDGHVLSAVAGPAGTAAPTTFLGADPHRLMYFVSAAVGLIGILAAAWFHWIGRTEAGACRMDAVAARMGPIPRWAEDKWYVDELYEFLFRVPLLVIAHMAHFIDRYVVDRLVDFFGWLPRAVAGAIRPAQSGVLHGYAVGMAGGVTVLLFVVLVLMTRAGG